MSSREFASASQGPANPMRRVPRGALVSLLLVAAAGCSWNGNDEVPPDAVARLTLIAMDDVNPNVAGVPSPIMVIFYELAEPQGFEGAEFSQLFYDDGSTLGTDVRARVEYRVEPGQIVRTNRVLDPDTRHLGFVAGYREIERAEWRILSEVEPFSTREHVLVVGARSLSLPNVLPIRNEDSAPDDAWSGPLDGLTDVIRGAVDAVLPGSE